MTREFANFVQVYCDGKPGARHPKHLVCRFREDGFTPGKFQAFAWFSEPDSNGNQKTFGGLKSRPAFKGLDIGCPVKPGEISCRLHLEIREGSRMEAKLFGRLEQLLDHAETRRQEHEDISLSMLIAILM